MAVRARTYQRVPQADVAPTDPADVTAGVSRLAGLDAAGGFDIDDEVSTSDDDEPDEDSDEATIKRKQRQRRSQRAARWSTKLHALLWVIGAASVAYAIDFFNVIFNDSRIKRGYFQAALVGTGINTCITAYLAIYLPYIKKISLEWSVYCPRMIPTATIVGVVSAICYICAFWPVWGLLTPGILALFFIGSLMTAHFLPAI